MVPRKCLPTKEGTLRLRHIGKITVNQQLRRFPMHLNHLPVKIEMRRCSQVIYFSYAKQRKVLLRKGACGELSVLRNRHRAEKKSFYNFQAEMTKRKY
jgi:hypothetical protein